MDRSRTILFSPFGLGMLDLAVGSWVFEQAKAAGKTVQINDFFYDLTRSFPVHPRGGFDSRRLHAEQQGSENMLGLKSLPDEAHGRHRHVSPSWFLPQPCTAPEGACWT